MLFVICAIKSSNFGESAIRILLPALAIGSDDIGQYDPKDEVFDADNNLLYGLLVFSL